MRGTRTCWGGRANVRAALYMPTLAAVRCNPALSAFYERLVAGVGVVFPVIDSGVLWDVGVGRMPNGVGTTAVGSAVAETDVGISSEVGA